MYRVANLISMTRLGSGKTPLEVQMAGWSPHHKMRTSCCALGTRRGRSEPIASTQNQFARLFCRFNRIAMLRIGLIKIVMALQTSRSNHPPSPFPFPFHLPFPLHRAPSHSIPFPTPTLYQPPSTPQNSPSHPISPFPLHSQPAPSPPSNRAASIEPTRMTILPSETASSSATTRQTLSDCK